MTPSQISRLSYQPFVFGASMAALIAKVAYSTGTRTAVFDSTLYAIIAIVVISAALYALDRRKQRRVTEMRADVRVGNVNRADVLGAESSKRDVTSVRVQTGDVEGGRVTGYREQRD